MSFLTRLAVAAVLPLGSAVSASAQDGSLTISTGFGPSSEVPDPRASYNG